MTIRVTETFYSIQSEGFHTGTPSIFVRLFGCNFRCKKFGLDKYESIEGPNPEVADVIKNIKKYKSLDDLPLVTTGCDSYPATYPEFKKFSKDYEIDELVTKIISLLPFKKWKDEHLVITGGEPLLWQKSLPELLGHCSMQSLKGLTFETNGTQALSSKFVIWLREQWLHRGRHALTFSVSPKLSCSGELQEDAIKPEIIIQYQSIGNTYLKFVVATEEDVNEAIAITHLYQGCGFNGPVYLMPLGGVQSTFLLNNKRVAQLALENGLRYSDRLQLSLFGNNWGT